MPTYHITFGARLHGGDKPTVNREQNKKSMPFIKKDIDLENWRRHIMKYGEVWFTSEQRVFIQDELVSICKKWEWQLHACACETNHLHVVIYANEQGIKIRQLLKRELSKALSMQYERIGKWWAKGGSVKRVDEEEYYRAAVMYVKRQRV